jgi:protein-tyrosine phosphatase
MNILFVCTANVSRSFFAERLFSHEAQRAGLDAVSVRSAGLFNYLNTPADAKMQACLSAMGADSNRHLSRQMTESDAEWADLIFVMERMHYFRVKGIWPRTCGKVDLLGRFVSEDQSADDIVDPFGRSEYHYRLAQSQIALAVRNLIQKLSVFGPFEKMTGPEVLERLRGE